MYGSVCGGGCEADEYYTTAYGDCRQSIHLMITYHAGPLICPSYTLGPAGPGKACMFPFTYGGTAYTSCTGTNTAPPVMDAQLGNDALDEACEHAAS